MKKNNNISMNIVRRLPMYHKYLRDLKDKNIIKVSSAELSEITGYTASQIRQDFNTFGGFGKQGYGYDVEELYKNISNILGIENAQNSVIIGAGHLGQAIINYSGFREHSLNLMAIFEIDESLIGKKINGLPVYHVDELEDYIKENNITLAVICTPSSVAEEIGEKVMSLGVKGIWNFAPIKLNPTYETYVENVSLIDSLSVLSYMINTQDRS